MSQNLSKGLRFILALAIVLALSIAPVVQTAAPVAAAVFSLLTEGSEVQVNGAYFQSYTPKLASGTGIFDPFLRVQGNGAEKGYNTNGTEEWDTKTGTWTHAIPLSEIPVVTFIPIGGGSGLYREIQLDTNESSNVYLTLSKLEIWRAPAPGGATITGYASPGFSSAGATLIWSLDGNGNNWIDLNYALNTGSGGRDNAAYFPESLFASFSPTDYFVLFCEFGGDGGYPSDAGFEEWGVIAAPSVELTKTASPTTVTAPGNVTYSYTVHNNGNVTLTGLDLTDNKIALPIVLGAYTLAPGDSTTGTATYTVTQPMIDAGTPIHNIATVTSNEDATATAYADVTVLQRVRVELDKTADPVVVDSPRDVTYSYFVHNNGNVTLTGLRLTDDHINDVITLGADTLAPGASTTGTATYTVTQPMIDAGNIIHNIATVTSNEGATAVATANVVVHQNPSVTIVKTASVAGDSVNVAGEVISYTVVVTNTGNMSLTGTLADTLSGISAISGPVESVSTNGILNVGETWTYTYTYTATQADIDNHGKNPANGYINNTATFTPSAGSPQSDSEAVPVDQNPAINIVKLTNGDDDVWLNVNDAVTWTYTVTNTGNVALSNITVTDNVSGVIPDPVLVDGYNTGDTDKDNKLDLSETWIFEDTGVAIAGPYSNTGTACGTPPAGDPVCNSDESSYVGQYAELLIDKWTESPEPVLAGTTLIYGITVYNQGPYVAHDVLLTDDVSGLPLVGGSVKYYLGNTYPPDVSLWSTWTGSLVLGDMPSETSVTVWIQGAVLQSYRELTIYNTACASSPTLHWDAVDERWEENDVCDSVSTSIKPSGEITRTWGFWKTHLLFTETVLGTDNIDLGWIPPCVSIKDVMGVFWMSKSGQSPLCQARLDASHQALAAILNSRLINGAPLPNGYDETEIAEILRCGTIEDIREMAGVLEAQNSGPGDTLALEEEDVPPANPKGAKAIAVAPEVCECNGDCATGAPESGTPSSGTQTTDTPAAVTPSNTTTQGGNGDQDSTPPPGKSNNGKSGEAHMNKPQPLGDDDSEEPE